MSNVTNFPPPPDMAEQMKGPTAYGMSVIIDGHRIPNLVMVDRGAEVEFTLDQRFSYSFPREIAYLAAAFAAQAMAIGAGYPFLGAATKDRPFAPKVMAFPSPHTEKGE
jgi:N-formylglutamate amidohydrolase